MLYDYMRVSDNDRQVWYKLGDRSFAEETLATLRKASAILFEYFELDQPFPLVTAILAPDRGEFDRLVADWLRIEIERPSQPSRMAQPQRTGLVVLSPSAYEQYSTYRYERDEYRRLLHHEMTHIFEEYLTPNMEATPRWWSEGLAAYLSGQWKYEDDYGFRQPALKGIRDGHIPDIVEIASSVELSYDWGWTIVKFIEDIHGKACIQRIVTECRNGDVLGKLGESIDSFQRDWKRWLLEDRRAVECA